MKQAIDRLFHLRRIQKRRLMAVSDFFLLTAALWLAYALRLGQFFPPDPQQAIWWLVIPLLGVLLFARLGLYRAVIRFMGTRTLANIALGIAALGGILLAASMLLQPALPRLVPLIFVPIAIMLVAGVRLLVRGWYHWWRDPNSPVAEPVLIFGAGVAGARLAANLRVSKRYTPVAFVDEDPSLNGSRIDGVEIHAPGAISELLELYPVRRILLAVPAATRADRRRILELLERYPLHVQTVPTIEEMFSIGAQVSELRDVDIGDLLGRDPVPPIPKLMSSTLRDRVILISGAGGSIGSALSRVALDEGARLIVLYEQSEFALYALERDLRAYAERQGLPCHLAPVLGSVGHAARIEAVLCRFGVQTVFHAAAYKHVPIVEYNLLEGIRNNVIGTRVFGEAAMRCGVERFVLISTDKAVRPTNVMGATKRLAERVVQQLATRSPGTVFSMVRFGNVLASSGSVVPLFHDQISRGGPVTVTHPNVTRYFMTLTEAAQLVVQAGAMARGGELFLLDMGEPVSIVHLARRMIGLHGRTVRDEANPGGDIAITFIGLRPGEKLTEELLVSGNATGTTHPKILRAQEDPVPPLDIDSTLARLEAADVASDSLSAYELLCAAVPDFSPSEPLGDWLATFAAGASTQRASRSEKIPGAVSAAPVSAAPVSATPVSATPVSATSVHAVPVQAVSVAASQGQAGQIHVMRTPNRRAETATS